jgi:adenylate cyclase
LAVRQEPPEVAAEAQLDRNGVSAVEYAAKYYDTLTPQERNVVSLSFLARGRRLGRLVRSLLVGFVAGLCGVLLALTPPGVALERNFGLDWLFKLRGAIVPPAEVAVVGINGKTGAALSLRGLGLRGRLPRDWERTIHGQLVERLVERNASVIVFDVDFSREKSPYEDRVFANAIIKANRVVLFEWLAARRERVFDKNGAAGGWTWVEERNAPTPVLANAARAIGPFVIPKLDKAALEFWAFKSSAGDAPTTAAIALQLKALGVYDRWRAALAEAQVPGFDELPAQAAHLREPADMLEFMLTLRRAFQQDPQLRQLVTQALDRMYRDEPDPGERRLLSALVALYAGPGYQYLNLYGPPGTIRTIPYEALLAPDGNTVADQVGDLTDHVVFVGYSDLYDTDQPDRFYTSFTNSDGVDLSGVEIMATAYANLLTQRAVWPSDRTVTVLCVLWFGLVVGIAVYLLPAMVAVPSVFAVMVAYAGIVQWRFNDADLWLPLAVPALVQLPLALLIGLMGQYLLERRKERRIARAISYYLPANIVKELTEKQLDPSSVNNVVFGTCLATDMSGFTTLAESKSPTELASFMNEYFDALAKVLKRHAVDVTEFHADTIMCAWTARERSPAVCRKAVLAAIDVSETIERFAREHGSIRLNPRIGLQDGHFYIGHMGGGGRLAYSIVGDTANTAARLESLNRHLGTHVLAAESVIGEPDGLLLRPLGSFKLRGKADATSVIEILGRRNNASADQQALCAEFADALAAFRTQKWSEAGALFEAVTERFADDGPSRFYLNRCRRYAAEPPIQAEPTVIQMEDK